MTLETSVVMVAITRALTLTQSRALTPATYTLTHATTALTGAVTLDALQAVKNAQITVSMTLTATLAQSQQEQTRQVHRLAITTGNA